MYSDKKSILQILSLAETHGIRKVVLCPGSRNAPLVRSFAAHPSFECYSVTDERSAGFFAIGLALQSHTPVAVCCTSGSALLNLHPAVAEAFYRQIPLAVISADRPAAWIGQMDGQTLPQPGVFNTLVKKAVCLPEIHNEEDEWYCNRLINEALLELTHRVCGPVHINIPLAEPLFRFTEPALPEVRCITRRNLSEETEFIAHLQKELPRYAKCLVVSGQQTAGEAAAFASCIGECRAAWLTELLGNVPPQTCAVRGFDVALYAADEEELARLRPDLLITFGGHIVSKRLKKFLRTYSPKAHWHITPDGMPVDLFRSLTTVVEGTPQDFWRLLAASGCGFSDAYPRLWEEACGIATPPCPDYSELYAVKKVMEHLPSGSVLHLANSSAVRLAELCPVADGTEVQCNRGVNGIEGSLSAAVGYAAASDRLNVVLIGDLSFFYDMNALWNSHVSSTLRIALLNNGGGGIFHTLPGLPVDKTSRHFVEAAHQTTAEGWARSRGLRYLKATDTQTLEAALPDFLDADNPVPVLLEVATDADTDAAEVKRYYHQIKDKHNKI